MEKLFNKYILYLLGFFQVLFFVVVKNDPFHGDAVTSTAKVALHIYENDLQTIWYPPLADPGHPTLFPYLLAVFWTVIGKSLWVAHALVGIISFCTLLIIRKIALLYTSLTKANISIVACAMYSIFVAQEALLLNTPLFFLWVLLSFYCLLSNKTAGFIVFSILMELTHLQANFFLLAFGFIYLYQSYDKRVAIKFFIARGLLLFIPALTALSLWLFFHQKQFGWAFLSPNYEEHNNIKGIQQFIQSVFLIIWRLLDNGMISIYALLIYQIIKKRVNKQLLIYTLIVLLVNAACMAVFLYNTIGHRYFLISQFMVLLLLIDSWHIAYSKVVYIVIAISLLLGNYMYYPGKVIADTNLQYRSFFKLEKEIKDSYWGKSLFYSYAPISTSGNIRYLNAAEGLSIVSLNDVCLDTVPILLQSNINAEFTKPQRDSLYANWYGQSFENGAVYVNVFLNPKYYEKPAHMQLRKATWFEQQLQTLKYRIRGE